MRGILFAIGIALGVILASPSRSQNNPAFNPNTAWGGTQGMIAIRGAANWQGLLPGSAGQALLSGGSGANPYWATLTGTGTVTSVNGSGGSTGLTVSGGPITTAGTLTLGGLLSPGFGGTGISSYANGDLIYATGATTLAKRAIGSNGQFLAVSSGVPIWQTFALSDLPAQPSMTIVANVTGGSAVPTTPTVTNLFDNAFGSTQGQLLYRGASGWVVLNPGSSGEFLKTNGPGGNPQWQAVSGALGGTVTSVACGSGLTGGTFTVSGTCAINAGALPGVANNSSATAGNVGEVISSNVLEASAIGVSPSVATNVTSISLTAGDWDISANGYFLAQPGSVINYRECSISATSATQNVVSPFYAVMYRPVTNGGSTIVSDSLPIPPTRVSLNSASTYYLVCFSNHSSAGASAFGEIRARRMR